MGAVDVITSLSSIQSNESLITAREPRHPISESYRSIRTNLRFSTVDRELETMLDVIVVANAKRTQLSSLTRTIESLRRIDAHICGVIINELSRSSRGYSYYGEYYAQPYGTYYGELQQD